jgi:hypothetical protein
MLIAELVDHALVQRSAEPDGIRLRLLEPIRIALTEKLPPASIPAHRAHANHFLRTVVDAMQLDDDELVLDTLLRREVGNLDQAFTWMWTEDPAVAIAALGPFLYGLHHLNLGPWTGWSVMARKGVEM